MQLLGRRYDTGQPVRLEIAQGRIARATPCASESQQAEHWPWIAPGLIDVQVNGYGGPEFSSPDLTPEKVLQVARAMDRFGVTRFCPTLTSERFEVLRHALRTIGSACESLPQVARRIAAVHLEGPYISAEDGARGAHPSEHCRQPDWDEFQRLQEAAEGRIGILTMAVEFEGSPAFIERLANSGVVVAIRPRSARQSTLGHG